MDAVLSLAFLAQVVRIALPYVLAGLGGAITERAGVVDLALEAKLLFGAFAAAVVAHATGSPLLGALGGMLGGVLVAAAQAALVLGARADHVVVCIGLNLVALAGTRFLLGVLYDEGANSPPFSPGAESLVANPIAWVAALAAIGVPWWLARTRAGLHARVAGDRPIALVAAGVSVARARLVPLLFGGALAGLGGAQLSLSVGVFAAEMSAGRGYLALAAIILAGWRPARVAWIALGLAALEALRIQLQVRGADLVPRELAQIAPYLLTLVVLVVVGAGRRPPAALGRTEP